MTKVIRFAGFARLAAACWLLVFFIAAWGQDAPSAAGGTAPPPGKPAEKLYLQLRSIGLDKTRVYHVRDVSFNRGGVEFSLEDGTIAFTGDVVGRVTGAFFEGDGEVLLMPPDRMERASMALFTGAPILEESFSTGYFRFDDNTFLELLPSLRRDEGPQEFLTQWDESARALASVDALRLMMSFSRFLRMQVQTSESNANFSESFGESMLHARLEGRKLGVFDIYFDTDAAEQVQAGQSKTTNGQEYYNVWSSYSLKGKLAGAGTASATPEEGSATTVAISSYKIRTVITPPSELEGDATLQVEVRQSGEGALLFELSRYLQVERVEADGEPVEFIHNQTVEGTDLSRRGNDLVAVVFRHSLRAGQRLQLHFAYHGQVLSAAGSGLLFVGARGTWYPNRGPAMAAFDLEFRYPPGWTLVATGKRVEAQKTGDHPDGGVTPAAGEQVTRWVSEGPIPMAGFNLGRYTEAVAKAGAVTVNAYGAAAMERSFPEAPEPPALSEQSTVKIPRAQPLVSPRLAPSPARTAPRVAADAAHAIDFFARNFGPFPYGSLSLTQMPGALSQGWPGLIYLSSFAFLTPEERTQLRMTPVEATLSHTVIAHETAHQWWGDLVGWSGYRNQWLVEALAEYSSLLMLESEDPAQFHAVMEKYREDLLQKEKNGLDMMEAGPVTFGYRLSNSQFPAGYEAISYGRGTWLLHMLRTMMRDGEAKSGKHAPGGADEPFVRALRKLRERFQGKVISTRDLLAVFEEELPPSLWYDGNRSLDWFYEDWVNGTAIPRLELQGVKYGDKAGSTVITGTIVQKDAPDDLVTSVPLYGTVAGRSVLLGRVFADGTESSFHLTAPAGARKVVIDPNQTLLARR